MRTRTRYDAEPEAPRTSKETTPARGGRQPVVRAGRKTACLSVVPAKVVACTSEGVKAKWTRTKAPRRTRTTGKFVRDCGGGKSAQVVFQQ
jgi:hypothetical protein